jgi:hypothetical protein
MAAPIPAELLVGIPVVPFTVTKVGGPGTIVRKVPVGDKESLNHAGFDGA